MKKPQLHLLFLLALFAINCNAQPRFLITEKWMDISYDEAMESLDLIVPDVFFEDSLYSVRKTCSGEWGGSLWFTNKRTGKEYSCSATCPVVINKLQGKYYVTASLAHLSGHTKVFRIDNPEALELVTKVDDKKIQYVGERESRSRKGVEVLVDSIGVLAMTSFIYEEQLYHVVTNFGETYLCKLENGRFEAIDTIVKDEFRPSNSEILRTKNGKMIVPLKNRYQRGYLEIENNTITVYRFRK